jgi:hypothetical protein
MRLCSTRAAGFPRQSVPAWRWEECFDKLSNSEAGVGFAMSVALEPGRKAQPNGTEPVDNLSVIQTTSCLEI